MKTSVSGEAVLEQLRAIAMADVTGVLQIENGSLTVRDTRELPRELRLAVSSVEKSTGGLKVKFYDKLKALELLGKHMGLFDQRFDSGNDRSHLLEDICRSTGEVVDVRDVPEIQQATAAGNELVESAGSA